MKAIPTRQGRTERRPSFCLSTDLPDIGGARTTVLSMARKQAEPTWKPNEANAFASKLSGNKSGNVIDRRTLYAIKRENIASRELGFRDRPLSKGLQGRARNSIEHQVEKTYITNSRLTNATPEIFPRVILKHFFRISAPNQSLGYGMPRPDTRQGGNFNSVMEGLNREPSLIRLDNYPGLQMPIRCDITSEFCEILGPSSCSECIENTNRHIGTELQHMLFPTIDMSVEKLIVPKLAQVLKDGHRHQVRKRRMHELGLIIPQELLFMKREESALTSRTCLKCKKKMSIEPPKIQITLPMPSVNSTTIPSVNSTTLPSVNSTNLSSRQRKKKKRGSFEL